MRPRDIIRKWVDAFNKGNVDEIAEFYHDDATNHQVANEPILGKAAIKEMFPESFLLLTWFVLWRIYLKMEIGVF